jgi:hypothetical protein
MLPWLIVATGWPQMLIAASHVATTPGAMRLAMMAGPAALAVCGVVALASLRLSRRIRPQSSPS